MAMIEAMRGGLLAAAAVLCRAMPAPAFEGWSKPEQEAFLINACLDDIEQGMLREEGAYDEPRVHFAVVCASIGCPMLRDEAFTAARLDGQLEDGMRVREQKAKVDFLEYDWTLNDVMLSK
ncbi:MAG TPA: DUF547 domain-containing protein [Usitatibacter sp.]|jgi:hypothetical protein|nr:DUF547 domain-containing protein [Usitatibacter sp.]